MSSPKTIRLQNTSASANLSLYLHQLKPSALGSMKKGPMLTPILIKAGAYYDVCAELKVSFDEAQSICTRSPDIQNQSRRNRLLKIEWPPPPAPAPVAAPPASAPASAPESVDVDEPAPVAVPEAPVAETAPAAAPEAVPMPEAAETSLHRFGEPSMDWSEDELRFYAEAKNIDVSKTKSKTGLLRAIRGAK